MLNAGTSTWKYTSFAGLFIHFATHIYNTFVDIFFYSVETIFTSFVRNAWSKHQPSTIDTYRHTGQEIERMRVQYMVLWINAWWWIRRGASVGTPMENLSDLRRWCSEFGFVTFLSLDSNRCANVLHRIPTDGGALAAVQNLCQWKHNMRYVMAVNSIDMSFGFLWSEATVSRFGREKITLGTGEMSWANEWNIQVEQLPDIWGVSGTCIATADYCGEISSESNNNIIIHFLWKNKFSSSRSMWSTN